jgi:hypothetical protein
MLDRIGGVAYGRRRASFCRPRSLSYRRRGACFAFGLSDRRDSDVSHELPSTGQVAWLERRELHLELHDVPDLRQEGDCPRVPHREH